MSDHTNEIATDSVQHPDATGDASTLIQTKATPPVTAAGDAPSPDITPSPPAEGSDSDAPTPAAQQDALLQAHEASGVDDSDTWLICTVAMIPIAAIIGVIASYATLNDGDAGLWSVATGFGIGVVMFGASYVLYQVGRFNAPAHASVVAYNDLCQRMDRVENLFIPEYQGADASMRLAASVAEAEIQRCGRAFRYGRAKRGLHWVLGKGYIDLGRTVHRAEEALIMREPVDMVMTDGFRDLSSLDGSTIPQVDGLLIRTRHALVQLSPSAADYFVQVQPPNERPDSNTGGELVSAQTQARLVLRHVRFTINEFRDNRKARLIDARNELASRMFLTALATSCLLVFIVLGHPSAKTLVTGAILYAVGATVGLFSRLYADLTTEGFADDYAISYVRLFQAFLLSGHAAVAGVFIAVVLPFAFNNPVFQAGASTSSSAPAIVATAGALTPGPVATASLTPVLGTAPAQAPAVPLPQLRPLTDIYNVDTNPFGIVLAMIFGLTPGLLVSRLAQGIEQYKIDLHSSEPAAKAKT